MRLLKRIIQISIFLPLTACVMAGPAPWADSVSAQLKCGMSVEEVKSIAQKNLVKFVIHEIPRPNGETHRLGGEMDTTVVSLSFGGDQLRWSQTHIVTGLTRMCSFPVNDLCFNQQFRSGPHK